MSDPVFFRDDESFTLTKHVAPVPGLHGALTFSYRPLMPLKRAEVYERVQATAGQNELKLFSPRNAFAAEGTMALLLDNGSRL